MTFRIKKCVRNTSHPLPSSSLLTSRPGKDAHKNGYNSMCFDNQNGFYYPLRRRNNCFEITLVKYWFEKSLLFVNIPTCLSNSCTLSMSCFSQSWLSTVYLFRPKANIPWRQRRRWGRGAVILSTSPQPAEPIAWWHSFDSAMPHSGPRAGHRVMEGASGPCGSFSYGKALTSPGRPAPGPSCKSWPSLWLWRAHGVSLTTGVQEDDQPSCANPPKIDEGSF